MVQSSLKVQSSLIKQTAMYLHSQYTLIEHTLLINQTVVIIMPYCCYEWPDQYDFASSRPVFYQVPQVTFYAPGFFSAQFFY